jgi:hypothetical protein
MQAGLFDKQEKEDSLVSSIIYDLFKCGKLHKFCETHIRKYHLNNNQPYTAILKHLREAQTIAVGVCISISEISLPRPLKTPEVNLYFNSNFKDEELVLHTDKEQVLKNLSELRNSYTRIAGSTRFIERMRNGKHKSGKVLQESFYQIFDCLFHLDELIDNIKKNDF